MNDKPKRRIRKYPQLWQSYSWWYELVEIRKRHNLRISAIERGDSNMDAMFEHNVLERMEIDALIKLAEKMMRDYGRDVPIWDWVVGIKGIGNKLAAQLLAQFDDISRYATVSKFWRFSGWGCPNGKIDKCVKGQKSPYNRRLKGICWNIAKEFIQHQTPIYADIYYAEKERQRRLHPVPICQLCGGTATQVRTKWKCSQCGANAKNYQIAFTPAHLERRAKRRMIEIFLQHLWLKWREAENLPVSQPYVQAVLGHTNIVPPPP